MAGQWASRCRGRGCTTCGTRRRRWPRHRGLGAISSAAARGSNAFAGWRAGAATVAVRDRAALVDSVAERLRPGDVVFTLGAGDVTRVGPELLRQLGGAEQP